jgi:hypothetical protein
MSVEDVPAVVNIRTLKGRVLVLHISSFSYWVGGRGGEECGKQEVCSLQSSISQKCIQAAGTKKLKKEYYGVDKYFLLL